MSIEVKVPDIGDFKDVEIVDVLVKVGDIVSEEDPLISLETDKAVMDIPSPTAGKIVEIKVAEGGQLNEGDLILLLEAASTDSDDKALENEVIQEDNTESDTTEQITEKASEAPSNDSEKSNSSSVQTVYVPDIGDFSDVNIVDILVSVGDSISAEDPLISLETDKAVMDVPSPTAGTVTKILVTTDDVANEGDEILELEVASVSTAQANTEQENNAQTLAKQAVPSDKTESDNSTSNAQEQSTPSEATLETSSAPESNKLAHAGPSVRKIARKLGVDLSLVSGSGPHQRILKEDVEAFVKAQLSKAGTSQSGSGFTLPPAKAIDFSQFGYVETIELTKINQLTGENTHNSWLRIPHVTHHDKADITELDAFRKEENERLKSQDIKLSILPFFVKAAVAALKAYPRINSSLNPDGKTLVLKQYFHISIAVDTPHGLMVPVIRDADKKSITEIAAEIKTLAEKAKNKRLQPSEMQGGCFSLSSLGHIGGTGFTPIVNEPEVAIMGITKSELQPKFINGAFEPRLFVPLSMSYDHRVVDGVLAANFTKYFASILEDIRKLLI